MTGPAASKTIRLPLGIRGRLILWFVMGTVGAVVIGGVVVYATGLASIQGTLGQTYCQIASRVVNQFEDRFRREAAVVRSLAIDVLTTEVVLEESEVYRNRPRDWVAARLDRQAGEWVSAKTEHDRRAFLHPQLSHRLSVLAGLGTGAIRRLSVYDIRGVLLAASALPSARHAIGQPWFKAVLGQKDHFNYLGLDKAAATLTVAVPVWGGVEIVGFAVAEHDSKVLLKDVENVRFGETGEALIAEPNGVPLSGPRRDFLAQALARRPAAAAAGAGGAGIGGEPSWIALSAGPGWPLWRRLACLGPMPAINALRARFDQPPWTVVVTQSPGESYVALRRSVGSLALVGLVGVFVVGIGGAVIALHITAPLKELQEGVRRFARGQRDRRVAVSSADEIGELAEEFNRMAERVTATENELRAFAQAVADATDAIVMTDPRGVIYYANPAFEATTGYSAAEIKGQTPAVLRAPRTPPDDFDEMWRAVEQGASWRGELWNRRKNGEDYPVDLTISPIRDEDGKVVALLGIHRDITLARQYQDHLEHEVEARTREIAETQGLTAMGRMASMIAHDLRNALSTVKMNFQILLRRHDAAGDVEQEHCRMGLDQVHYMEEILHDMLSYARPGTLRSDWYDVPQIIDEALVAVSDPLGASGVDVVREDGKGLPKVYCDRVKVMEVLRNLFDNAISAMPDGGRLSVATFLMFGTNEPMLRLAVRDSGEGIPADVLPSVQDAFFTTRSKGTGLGLAIVKRIVEQHGGTVDIRSKPGLGTEVAFTLPTAPPSSQEQS